MFPRLFRECIVSLRYPRILSVADSNKIFLDFEKKVPITTWGRIDWDNINDKLIVDSANEIITAVEQLAGRGIDLSIHILWNDGSIPVVKSNLDIACKHIDDVICVAPDTWFLSLTEDYFVEKYHDDDRYFIGIR